MNEKSFTDRSRYLKRLLTLSAGGGWLLTTLGFLGRAWWPFEIMSHFRLQYFVVLSIFSFLLAAARLRMIAGVSVFFAVVNLAYLLPYYQRPAEAGSQTRLRLLAANVRVSNREPALLVNWVEQVRPDIIVLIEATERYVESLDLLKEAYPFQELSLDLEPHGLALFSRRPLNTERAFYFEEEGFPDLIFRLEESPDLTFIGFHPPPPSGAERLELRTREMNRLAARVEELDGAIVIVGDFNSTPWSPYFQEFLNKTGLREARKGFGLQRTWPVNLPLLRIPIDHALVSEGVRVHRFSTGPDIGSDHFPILVDIAFGENQRGAFLSK